jgi:hypothetical protein
VALRRLPAFMVWIAYLPLDLSDMPLGICIIHHHPLDA